MKPPTTLKERVYIPTQEFEALGYPSNGRQYHKMPQYVVRQEMRVSQGDIYKDLKIIEARDPASDSKPRETTYGYAIVLSQECDLEWDWQNYKELESSEENPKHDKLLRHIILTPCYPFEMFLEGDHIAERSMTNWKSFKKPIKQNNHKRFHFLSKQDGVNLPNLVVDFKHYFTVERDVFYKMRAKPGRYVCSLDSLYREELSRRFAAHQARIGLPDERAMMS